MWYSQTKSSNNFDIKIHTWVRGLGDENKRYHFEAQGQQSIIFYCFIPLKPKSLEEKYIFMYIWPSII